MSYALQLLLGGALFMLVNGLFGIEWVVALGLALLVMELIYDLRRHRKPADG